MVRMQSLQMTITKAAVMAAFVLAPLAVFAQDNASPTRLVNQIEQLKQQNSELQGRLEVLEHKLARLEEVNKRQYVALEDRLDEMGTSNQGGKSASGGNTAGSGDSTNDTSSKSDAKPASSPDAAPPIAADPTGKIALSDHAGAEAAYQKAFDTMRSGNYTEASRLFVAFIKEYPNDTLTPNAWYWLGESHYIVQHYEQALQAFSQVVASFPDSGKSSGALLKKGYSEFALDRLDAAEATFKQVIDKYPESDSAKLAVERLKDVQRQRSGTP